MQKLAADASCSALLGGKKRILLGSSLLSVIQQLPPDDIPWATQTVREIDLPLPSFLIPLFSSSPPCLASHEQKKRGIAPCYHSLFPPTHLRKLKNWKERETSELLSPLAVRAFASHFSGRKQKRYIIIIIITVPIRTLMFVGWMLQTKPPSPPSLSLSVQFWRHRRVIFHLRSRSHGWASGRGMDIHVHERYQYVRVSM